MFLLAVDKLFCYLFPTLSVATRQRGKLLAEIGECSIRHRLCPDKVGKSDGKRIEYDGRKYKTFSKFATAVGQPGGANVSRVIEVKKVGAGEWSLTTSC